MRRLLIASLVMLLSVVASAQPQSCPPLPAHGSIPISAKTKAAVDLVTKLIGKAGVSADLHEIGLHVLQDEYPDADEFITVKTMIHVYCEVVWSDPHLSETRKSSQVQQAERELSKPVQGPAAVARTGSTIKRSQDAGTGSPVLASTAGTSAHLVLAQDNLPLNLPKPQTEFLRDAPVFVNNSNKYFVIVGSSSTKEDGISLMNRLKKKAPAYDFELYEPYGENSHYGVMMATWVPYDVAKEALQLARRYVAPDALIWSCRSSGDSC